MEKSFDQLAQELEKEKRKNKLLHLISHELNKLTTLENKLNNILEILDTSFNLKHSIILIPTNSNTTLKVFASRGFPESGIGVEVPYDYGFVGVVAKKKKKVRIARLSQYYRYAAAIQKEKGIEAKKSLLPGLPNAESQVVLPLIANDELVAVISFESEDILFFHQSDEDYLMAISEQIALSIQNSIVFEKLEERVEQRTRELERINRTKDRLFAIIGHDLRSPVTALLEVAELFKYYSSKGEQEKLLNLGNKISQSAENVNQLLDNLLNWSLSQQEGIRCAKQAIAVQKIVDETYQVFKDSIASKEIDFTPDICKGASVMADYNMLFSVLRNVLSNAIKFTKPKGKIALSTRDLPNQIQITIKDTGVGIDREKIKNLFTLQEGKSTLGTQRERGTGLGLVLVHEFIKINGGSIDIESSPDGTSIHLFLPKS